MRKLQHRGKEKRAPKYGKGLGLILGLGFRTEGFAKRALRVSSLREGGVRYGGGERANSVGSGGGGGRSRSDFVCVLGVKEIRENERGVFSKFEEEDSLIDEGFLEAMEIRVRVRE